MDKFIGIIFKYADKKTIPLLGLFVLVGYYAPILGQKHIGYSISMFAGLALFTIIYNWVTGLHNKNSNLDVTINFIHNELDTAKANALDSLKFDDPDKEMAVRIFLVVMIDEIRKVVDQLILDRDYNVLIQKTLDVKETIRHKCDEHNVPLEIYHCIHRLNVKRVTQFYDILKHIIVTQSSYTDSEKLHITLIALYHFMASLIDSTLEASDEMNGGFTKSYDKYKQAGKYIIPIFK